MSLNPVYTVGDQIAEPIYQHQGLRGERVWEEVISALRLLNIPDPDKRLRDYPFQLSGGMRQRVVGAIAMSCHPRLLIADDFIQIVDFKTGSRVPRDAEAVERYHLRQMAAYAAALAKIFPDRRITAALLFTHDATLIDLPAELLAAHAPGVVADATA